MRSCCCCPCWSYFFYTAGLGAAATMFATAALADEDIAGDADLQHGCRLLAASGIMHFLASIYIMVRLQRSLKDFSRMQDYLKGLDSAIIQETIMQEMWKILIQDCIFRLYFLAALASYLHAMAFAGRGALTGLENKLPQQAVFCLVLHMVLTFSLTCCWKSAICCGIFCESFSSLLLPQSPAPELLDLPVEIKEQDDLASSLVDKDAAEPPMEVKPVQHGMQAAPKAPPATPPAAEAPSSASAGDTEMVEKPKEEGSASSMAAPSQAPDLEAGGEAAKGVGF